MLDLPVVLAHGYLGFKSLGPLSYFSSARSSLEALGAKVYVTEVSPKGSLRERSNQLALEIRSFVPSGKVHVIAHSMGGLDARYLISHSSGSGMIATLTTLGTPFGGTLAADIRVDPTTIAKIGAAKLADTIWNFATDSILHPAEAILKHFTLLK